jgi:hypothetical protein
MKERWVQFILPAVAIAFVTIFHVPTAQAEGGDDLRAKVQNPVSSMYSLPLKLTADFGASNGSAYFFNVNPVIPVTVGNWNLISRALFQPSSAWTEKSREPHRYRRGRKPATARPA